MAFETFRHLPDQPIVFTDLETTGLSTKNHEIIELGAVITTPDLEVIEELNFKIQPMRIETASPISLEVNGFDPEDWWDAISLREAIETFAAKTKGASFGGHNAPFDWRFINAAYDELYLPNELSGHVVDNLKFARTALKGLGFTKFTQEAMAIHFGLEPEPAIHRAVNGARLARDIYGKLIEL